GGGKQLVERSKELMCKAGRVLVAKQIRAGDCAREQAAAAEQQRRLVGSAGVFSQIADMLRCMARCCNDRQLDLADRERVAIAHRLMIELQMRVGAGDNARTKR